MRGHVRKIRKSGNRAARRPPQRRATFFAKALTYVHAKKTFKESTDGVSPHARSTHARKRSMSYFSLASIAPNSGRAVVR